MTFARPELRDPNPVWRDWHASDGSPQNRGLRDAFGTFATGVTVVTAQGPKGPVGMTANSFSSVSLDPPLVLWSPAKSSQRFGAFAKAEQYAIHVLAADQRELALHFARNGQGFETFPDTEFTVSGVPILTGCLAVFECQTYAVHDAGDHALVLGRVQRARHRSGPALVFRAGQFENLPGV